MVHAWNWNNAININLTTLDVTYNPVDVLQKYPNFKIVSYVFGYHGHFS